MRREQSREQLVDEIRKLAVGRLRKPATAERVFRLETEEQLKRFVTPNGQIRRAEIVRELEWFAAENPEKFSPIDDTPAVPHGKVALDAGRARKRAEVEASEKAAADAKAYADDYRRRTEDGQLLTDQGWVKR